MVNGEIRKNKTIERMSKFEEVEIVEIVEDGIISDEEVTVEETRITYNGSMDDLEKEFGSFIQEMETANNRVTANINMDELNEISEDIIKAKDYLSAFASGEKKTVREKAYNQLTSLPLIGGWAKSKVEEVQVQALEDSTVKEVLNGIFSSFDVKKRRLIELTGMMDGMRTNLLNQEMRLGDYIEKLNDIILTTTSPADKMRAVEMSVMAQSQDKITKEMVYNNLNIIMELMEGLHHKISKTLPVIKNTLTNSLNIVGTINSIRDAVDMMNTLETLSNEINQKSTNNIQTLVINTTRSLSDGTDIEFYKLSAKRNEEFNETLLEARKQHIATTLDNYETLKEIGIDASNQIEYRREQEAIALGMNIETSKAANTSNKKAK